MHMRRGQWFGVALCLLALGPTAGWAAEAEEERPVPRPASARRDGNIIRVNAWPTVLAWAPGLTDAADLEAYAAAGLNTLAVPITSTSEEALSEAFALASAAEERGLLVVASLAPQELDDASGEKLAPDPASDDYAAAVAKFVEAAAARMGGHPRLIAWAVEAVVPDDVVWNDAGFQAFLRQSYRSIGAVNNSWGTSFTDFTDITTGATGDIDAALPGGIGRARVDLAEYRRQTYADTMDLWAKAILRASPGTLVFAGNLVDYRSMISLGTDFDGLIAATTPSAAEVDLETSNVQAVDIARRANQFAALQTLDLTGQATANQVGNWVNLALLHGASGLVFWNWPALKGSEALRGQVQQMAAALGQTGWFPATPNVSAAVLYEPYAGGTMRYGRSLYGYLDGVTDGEPSNLFQSFRNGSRYGLLDVLSLDSLGTVDIARYSVLIVPAAFYLPEEVELALNRYVLQGGALVADAGIGMYQAKGTVDSIPEITRDTLGLQLTELGTGSTESEGAAAGQESPFGTQSGGPVAVPVQPGVNIETGGQLDALAQLVGKLLQGPEASKYLGAEFGGPDSPGLRVHGMGKGFTVYAPAFLYQQWDSNSDSFAEFHDRVLGWGHDAVVVSTDALWPPVAITPYAADRSLGVAAPTSSVAAVDLTFAPNQVYLVPDGAQRVANPDDDTRIELLFPGDPLSVARPLPITATSLDSGAVPVIAVTAYGPERITMTVNGNGATVNPARTGLSISGGEATNVEIAIYDGTYRVAPGSMHHAVWREGRRVVADTVVMPDTESGALVLRGDFATAQLEITPAPEAPAEAPTQ
jgi:hypothetical protein